LRWFNANIPTVTPAVRAVMSRIAVARPRAKRISVEYESAIATLLTTVETRRCVGFNPDDLILRRVTRLAKYSGGAR